MIISRVFDAQRAAEMGGVLDTAKLIEDIAAQNKPAFAITDVDEIVRSLTSELHSGDVVVIMSNGAFGGIHEKLLAVLRESNAWVRRKLSSFDLTGRCFSQFAKLLALLFGNRSQ